MTKIKQALIPFLAGVLLHAGLWVGVGWLYSSKVSSIGLDSGVVDVSLSWLDLLRTLLPGLVAGFLCKRSPFAIGFLAILVGSLAMHPFSWHPIVVPGDPPLIVQAIERALRDGVFGAVAAGAGFLIASRMGANNSFKPNPLRGSA